MADKAEIPAKIAEEVLAGSERSAARLISLIEQEDPEGCNALLVLFSHAGKAHVVGLTGSAGAGKSTLVNALAASFIKEGRKIGVIAIDPSSATGGGSLLGDRIRMKELENSRDIFIRSMAQRNHPGGVCSAAVGAVCVMEGMGKDLVMIESIGAGQADRDLLHLADTVIAVFTPEYGDEIQLMKAGLLEIGDIVVVNKSDKLGAEDLKNALEMYVMKPSKEGWKVPVILTEAQNAKGLDEVIDCVKSHYEFIRNDLKALRSEKYARFTESLLKEEIWRIFLRRFSQDVSFTSVINAVQTAQLDPYNAAKRIAAEFDEVVERGKTKGDRGGL